MYKITSSYHWYKVEEEKYIIKVYFINYVPFTFNEVLAITQQNPEVILEADRNIVYTPELFFLSSFYLVDEQCHPCLFELELENPEALDEIDREFQTE